MISIFHAFWHSYLVTLWLYPSRAAGLASRSSPGIQIWDTCGSRQLGAHSTLKIDIVDLRFRAAIVLSALGH
jgi:hypothetical protein